MPTVTRLKEQLVDMEDRIYELQREVEILNKIVDFTSDIVKLLLTLPPKSKK